MILPEHGGESVFQQDYLRGMQYNVYAKALFAPFGNQNHTLKTRGNCHASRAEMLILRDKTLNIGQIRYLGQMPVIRLLETEK